MQISKCVENNRHYHASNSQIEICIFLAVAFLFSECFPLYAQKVATNEAERMVQIFANAYASPGARTEEQLAKLIALADPGLSFESVAVAISGNKKMRNGDISVWLQYLRRMHQEGNATVMRSFKKIGALYVQPNNIYANVHFEFTYIQQGKILVKGDEHVSILLRRVDETQWRIIDIRSMMIETEKFRGTCLCEIFTSKSSSTNSVSAKITMPSGGNYRASTIVFELVECDPRQKTYLIRITNYEFKWLATGELYLLKDNKQCDKSEVDPEMVGIAFDQKEVFGIIIRKYLFEFECAQIAFK
ncbi:MAG: hypothetical protein RMJ87_10640 [Cytophagales bacterium]|nr:hypothetical protein [Bernardetiaceae bacterium]MDW8205476.1 hypothetical protein [Cytophagales bacterium]